MIRIKLMDDSLLEIPREDVLELIPYRHVFRHSRLKSPVEALLAHHGKLVPVLGPLAPDGDQTNSIDKRPWLLLMKGCAQVIRGLPEFQEAAQGEIIPLPGSEEGDSTLLDEIGELLKSA